MKKIAAVYEKNFMMCCCCQTVCMNTVYFSYALCT